MTVFRELSVGVRQQQFCFEHHLREGKPKDKRFAE